jgi:hypothetical protein
MPTLEFHTKDCVPFILMDMAEAEKKFRAEVKETMDSKILPFVNKPNTGGNETLH